MFDLEEYFVRNIQYEKLTETLKKAITFYGLYMAKELNNESD